MLDGSLDRIRNILEAIRARLWLIPVLMSLLAAVAARAVVRAGDIDLFGEPDTWWYFGGDADTARDLLATLLSGMITMSTLVISLTMVVLSLAAGQLGPRLIWTFIRDRQMQAVIGIFFATIAFILVVLRSVSAGSVPAAAVTTATVLVAGCLLALLFYVHKVARSIVADTVVNDVAAELDASIAELADPEEAENEEPPVWPGLTATGISFGRSGYLQVIEYRKLANLAAREKIAVETDSRAGHFVLAGGTHVLVHHAGPLSEALIAEIRSAFVIGSQRTPTQDLEYSVRQLVEIAVRALSPGISDPFTAIVVVHRLGEALEQVMRKHLPERIVVRDRHGAVRVVGVSSRFSGLADAAFNQIRQAAAADKDVAILIAMAGSLGQLGALARTADHRAVLAGHLERVARAARRCIAEEDDLADFEAVCAQAARQIRSGSAGIRA